jgi:hypothetical protein
MAKQRWFLTVLLGLSLLLGACGDVITPTVAPTPTVPATTPTPSPVPTSAYVGTWRGQVVQPNFGSYEVIMVITDLKFNVAVGGTDYPSLECGYSLSLIDTLGGKYVLREKMERIKNPGTCIEGGTIQVQLNPNGGLTWEWFFPDGRSGAYSVLSRNK